VQTNASKTQGVIQQHNDKTLEQLVAAKIINADQRAQALKIPQLEGQLAQLEEQLAQYKKVDEEYRSRNATDKAKLEQELSEKFEKEKADAVAAVTETAAADSKKLQHDSLLVLSQFLRLAAARRSEEADAGLDENMALEGVLLNVYSGDENAVATMLKLINGSDEKTRSVNGDDLQTTCMHESGLLCDSSTITDNNLVAQVKEVSIAQAKAFAAMDAEAEPPTELPAETDLEATEAHEAPEGVDEPISPPETDPTIDHAGLTEIDDTGYIAPMTNGHTETTPISGLPTNADTGDHAANAAAEAQWDAGHDLSASLSQEEWVKVPRDPVETDTGLSATPAAAGPVQSWADDQPESVPEVSGCSMSNRTNFPAWPKISS
jgi:hypothetical protein